MDPICYRGPMKNRRLLSAPGLLLVAVAWACTPEPTPGDPPPDADPADVDPADISLPDAGFPDGAPRDAAPPLVDMAPPTPDMAPPAPDMAPPTPDMAPPAPDMAPPAADMAPPPPDMAPPPPDMGLGNPLLPAEPNRTCALPEAPPIGRYAVERAFPGLAFQRPIWLGTAPGEPEAIYVAEQGGTIWAFDDDPDVAERSRVLELPVLRSNNEEGLLGLAFHPDYADNGRLFVNYSTNACPGSRRCSVVAEFARADERVADPDSEVVLLRVDQPYGNHNGGDLRFGPDGLLYISLGDGGSGGDPQGNGQNPETLLGSILRIDVDRAADDPACPGCRYAIPPDNPFADGVGGAPEVWAWGLRNVWRMAFDDLSGALWAADVGQNAVEEINRITGPGDFGWNIMEGDDCYGPIQACRDAEGLEPPVWTYRHPTGESVTGGLIYRGPRLPELWGAYVFGDYVSGRLWALRPGDDGPVVEEVGNRRQVTHFGADAAGRMYLTSFAANLPIGRLVPVEPPDGSPFPERLSETGCFADVATHTLAPGVVPYRVNRPFWSDGADKLRAVALPEGARVTVDPDDPEGGYRFPVGAVLIKSFALDAVDDDGQPAAPIVATRLLTRQATGWRGFVYRWDDALGDGVLLDGPARTAYRAADGPHDWIHPSRVECNQCHTAAAGEALGWRTRQLAGVFELDGVRYDQLPALVEAGVLEAAPGQPAAHPRPVDGALDGAALEAAARATLDVNCAPCHQPGGGANAGLDLRAQVPLVDTGLCAAPGQGDLGIDDARLIAPGDRGRSVVLQRMLRRDGQGMPPLGSARIDDAAVARVGQWIDGLAACPEPAR